MASSPFFINICTPTSGGTCKTDFTASLAATVAHLERQGIRTSYSSMNGGHVSDQRDALAHLFLNKTEATHLLFIDSDMKFPPELAAKLLSFDKEVVGTVYTKRQVDVAKLRNAADESLAYDFIYTPVSSKLSVNKGLCEVETFGFGFVLIRREAFLKLKDAGGIISYYSRYVDSKVDGFFREIDLPDGRRVSEDLSFCRRWRECGGSVWAYASAKISHVGDFAYGTPFLQYLRSIQHAAPAAVLAAGTAPVPSPSRPQRAKAPPVPAKPEPAQPGQRDPQHAAPQVAGPAAPSGTERSPRPVRS